MLTRRVALDRAAEFVLGGKWHDFTHGTVPETRSQRFVLVDRGSEMLRRFLEELDAIMAERGAVMAPIEPPAAG
jgi:hypothetical protein